VILLLSTYDLGRQPFGLASPAAWLRRAGLEVAALDLSREALDIDLVARAALVAFYLPMHTATRLALPVIARIRAINAGSTLCGYGLYAPLNQDLLRESGVHEVLGPEYEADLVALARRVAGSERVDRSGPATDGPVTEAAAGTATPLPRLQFVPPDRDGLPAPARYATLRMPDGSGRTAGSTDATRGCKHRCRHCPIVPVYDGQFRVVPADVVLADIRAQVARGVHHISFGDPDFLNGPTHARRIVEALHVEWPHLTYDVTIKVEHLVAHRALLPALARTGCLFVTSAVESLDDRVLACLEKGHTRADFVTAVEAARDAGLTLAPTFVAFTPWTTLEAYRNLLDTIDAMGLVPNVAPVQWAIRLLIPWRSPLLELREVRAAAGDFDSHSLTHPWRHPDPAVDRLQAAVMHEVGVGPSRPRSEIFAAVRRHLDAVAGTRPSDGAPPALASRATIPYLEEPWYC